MEIKTVQKQDGSTQYFWVEQITHSDPAYWVVRGDETWPNGDYRGPVPQQPFETEEEANAFLVAIRLNTVLITSHPASEGSAKVYSVSIQTGFPTDGKTVYYQDDSRPMIDLGRVAGKAGMHVCEMQDGTLIGVGGFNLRYENDTARPWADDDLQPEELSV